MCLNVLVQPMDKLGISEETFLWKMPRSAITKLEELLRVDSAWERLAAKIPHEPDHIFTGSFQFSKPRFSLADIKNLAACEKSVSALINNWNMQNPRIKHLVKALYLAELNAAAVYIQECVLGVEPVRCATASCNNTTSVETPEEMETNNSVQQEAEEYDWNQNGLLDIHFSYLKAITNNFDERPFTEGGSLIGEGGFGKVFRGVTRSGVKVAVKYLKDSNEDSLKQFETEVKVLEKYKHQNLVKLLGYSISNASCCLVYEYMCHGSLEERLACRYGSAPLLNETRLEILKGTARGVAFLHDRGVVHRDIKSANILLDADYKPKVGDFATSRVVPNGMTGRLNTSVVIGTQSYLAPEATSFKIQPGLDTFSFGVVILEILTGLPVTDSRRENIDLKIHVQEHCSEGDDDEEAGSIYDLLDQTGGAWKKTVVDELYSISCQCLENYKKRPSMKKVLGQLESLEHSNDRLEWCVQRECPECKVAHP